MNREQRAELARETIEILTRGTYQTRDGREVSLQPALILSCAGTRLYLPGDGELEVGAFPLPKNSRTTEISVTNETTLSAARRLRDEFPAVMCLNFASAKNPGGGFLSGSEAQEESLARSSGLYATLRTQPEFYEFHDRNRSPLYSDRAIVSPDVPVFRDDSGAPLSAPYAVSFVTAAAVNAGAVSRNEPENRGLVGPTMARRARVILSVAARHEVDALVLGAWGCGVFQNDPARVAQIFADALAEPAFFGRFTRVTFAVFDQSENQTVLRAFEKQFASCQPITRALRALS